MVIWAISMSIAPFVGQNWGGRKFQRVWRAVSLANSFALAWGALSYLLLLFAGSFIVYKLTDDVVVAEAASIYLLIVPAGMGLMGITANASNSFNALGQPLPPLLMSLTQMIVLTVPLSILGNFLIGFPGIFLGGLVAIIISATVMYFWLRRNLRLGERALLSS